MLSNISDACSVLSPARAGGAGLSLVLCKHAITKVEVSEAALTLLGRRDSFLLPFTASQGAAEGDVRSEHHQFPFPHFHPH